MTDKRWKAVERGTAEELNRVLSGIGNFTPVERIPLLGREGPDLTINETGLVINVKSRQSIPDRLFPKKNELLFIQQIVCFRLDELSRISQLAALEWTPSKPWKQLSDWLCFMDKWTNEFRRDDGISAIFLHRPRMPYGNMGVAITFDDLRRLQCQIKQHQSK